MQEFYEIANRLADEAGEIVRQYFRQPFDVINKSDASPVTVADRAVEQRLREIIEAERPQDGIYGEEFGKKPSESGLTWVLDPIDGTKSFVIGRPTFGTLIALCEGSAPVVGVIDQAISGERWVGGEEQTTFNGQVVRTRPCASLAEACVGSTTPAMFEGVGPVYERIEKSVKMMAWGGDCYMYGLVASGFMDATIEASLSPYDYAALVPIIKGAGGHISDYAGEALTLESDGKVVACGDKKLWPELAKLL